LQDFSLAVTESCATEKGQPHPLGTLLTRPGSKWSEVPDLLRRSQRKLDGSGEEDGSR
jgi:hypothetical protein